MTPNGRKRRLRLVLTPVSPVTGQRRAGAVHVYTWPQHRALSRWRRWGRASAHSRIPILCTPEGYKRWDLHIMDEEYYQANRPAGTVVHLGNRVDRFAPQGDLSQ